MGLTNNCVLTPHVGAKGLEIEALSGTDYCYTLVGIEFRLEN
jgi:hypothetical protein